MLFETIANGGLPRLLASGIPASPPSPLRHNHTWKESIILRICSRIAFCRSLLSRSVAVRLHVRLTLVRVQRSIATTFRSI